MALSRMTKVALFEKRVGNEALVKTRENACFVLAFCVRMRVCALGTALSWHLSAHTNTRNTYVRRVGASLPTLWGWPSPVRISAWLCVGSLLFCTRDPSVLSTKWVRVRLRRLVGEQNDFHQKSLRILFLCLLS